MCKKIIALLCAALLIAAPVWGAGLNDIGGNQYEKAIAALFNLGIIKGYEDGSFNPDEAITRLEYAVTVLRMNGLENVAQSLQGMDSYDDIAQGHWAYDYAYLLKDLGIVEGIGDNLFGTENSIMLTDALKMILCSVGYREAAEAKGGYPSGYLIMGSDLGLLKGMNSIGQTQELTRGQVAGLLRNALDMPLIVNDVINHETRLVERMLGFTKIKGTVGSTFEVQLEKSLRPNQIEIDGRIYTTDMAIRNYDGATLFGARVTAYANLNESSDPIIYHLEASDTDDMIRVEADEIFGGSGFTSFKYERNDRTRTLQIAANPVVIYNGKLLETAYITDQILRPSGGYIIFRNISGGRDYDTVIITEYKVYAVSSISDGVVYDRTGAVLDTRDSENVRVVFDGAEVKFGDIEVEDVLTVIKDRNDANMVIYISRDYDVGRVIEMQNISNLTDTAYVFQTDNGAVEYRLSGDYARALNSGHYSTVKFELGGSYKVFLDIDGRIAAVDTQARRSEKIYGYFMEAAKAGGDLSNELEIKVLTTNNKFEVFKAAGDKIKFGRPEGGGYVHENTPVSDVAARLVGAARQVITYALDEEGNVIDLCLASPSNNRDHLSVSTAMGSYTFRNRMFDDRYWVDANTAVFSIPHNGQYLEYLAAGSYNDLISAGAHRVELYDVDTDGYVNAIVMQDTNLIRYNTSEGGYEVRISSVNSPIIFVNSLSRIIDEDGIEYAKVNGIQGGKEISVLLGNSLRNNSEAVSNVVPGAIIQYEMNSIDRARALTSDNEEQIVVLKKVINLSEDNPNKTHYNYSDSYINRLAAVVEDSSNRGLVTTLGEIYFIDNDSIRIRTDSMTFVKNPGIVVMSYNANRAVPFQLRKLEDLQLGMRIFARKRNMNTIEIVYYEN